MIDHNDRNKGPTLFKAFFKRVVPNGAAETVGQPIYRIVESPESSPSTIHFQMVGKRSIISMRPEQIMRDNMLMGFSKGDIAIITHLGTKAEYKAEALKKPNAIMRIIHQLFTGKHSTLLVQNTESKTIAEKSPSDLYFDPSTHERYSAADALLIGYSAAEERYKKIIDETISKPQYRLSAFADHQVHYLPIEGGATQIANVETVFNDKTLLAQFNPEEQSLLGYAAAESRYQRITHEMHPAPVWVLAQTVVGDENLWHCRSLLTNEERIFSVEELFYNTELLKQLSEQDRTRIAFAAGELYKARQAEINKPQLQLCALADHQVHYRPIDEKDVRILDVETLFNDKTLLAQFNAEEQSLLSYAAAESRYQRIMHEMHPAPTWRLSHTEVGADNLWHCRSLGTDEECIFSVEELFYNTELLKQLSEQDRARIAFAAGELYKARQVEELLKPQYQICGFTDYQVHYRPVDEATIHIADVESVFHDKALLAQFSAEAQSLLGYTAAESRYQRIAHEVNPAPEWMLLHTEVGETNQWHCRSVRTDEERVFSVEELFYNTEFLQKLSESDRTHVAFAAGELYKARQVALSNGDESLLE